MGLSDFWLQFNNGNKEQLSDTEHGVRREQVDKKFHNLFDAYDANKDGTLERNELNTIFGHLKAFAGDNVFDTAENQIAQSVFAAQVNMQDVDFQGFVKSVSDAGAEIISSTEKRTSDGGKEIKTEYKYGTTETIAYYPNGDFKWKKIVKHLSKTVYEMSINGEKREITEEQFKEALKKQEETKNKPQVSMHKGAEGQKVLSASVTQNIKLNSKPIEWDENKQIYSPRFIAEKLGININTEEGKKILERISYLPQESLEQIKDGAEVKELLSQNDLSPDFDNISNVLELVYGITLRDENEYEAAKPQRDKIIQQLQTVAVMSELYARVAEFNDAYTDNQGLFGMGAEGFGWILNKIGLDGENHYQWADSCREFIEKINGFKALNPEKFEAEFKELTGKSEFNVNALQKMSELAKNGKAQDSEGNYTEEYKQAVKEFSNFDITNPNAKAWYHPDNLINGFGEALVMIMTLGWGAETKAGQLLAASTMSTFSRAGVAVASKQFNNRLLQGAARLCGKGVKLLGPALNEGTKMYAYTAATGTAANVANRAIKFDSEENSLGKFWETEGMILDGASGSFTFGAFAGIFGSTVTQKVMQSVSKVSTKVGNALSDKFAKGAVDASEVFATILEKSAPTKIAEAAAFAVDVLGFTAFESALAIAKNMEGFPDDVTVEDIADVLAEEFQGQTVNLGQIKGISYLIMWLTGSRSARLQATQYMKGNIPHLKGVSVEGVNGGKDGYKINLADGRTIECKNTNEMISALHLMVRKETAFSKKFDMKTNVVEINDLSEMPSLGDLHVITSEKLREMFNKNPELNQNTWWQEHFESLLDNTERKAAMYKKIDKLAAPIIQKKANYARKLLLEKIMNEPDLYNNPVIQKFLRPLKNGFSKLSYTQSVEQCKTTYAMMKKVVSDNRLQSFNDIEILINCYSEKIYNFRTTIIDRILNDPILSGNEKFITNFASNIFNLGDGVDGQIQTSILRILDKVTSNEKLYKNENVMENLYQLLLRNQTLESSQMVIEFFDTILNTPEFANNSYIIENLGFLADNEQKGRLLVLNTIINNKEYKNNKDLVENMGMIAHCVHYYNSAELMIKMLEKIYSKEEFKNNSSIKNHVVDILMSSNNTESFNNNSKMMDLLFSKEEYKNNKRLMESAHTLIEKCSDSYLYDNMSKMLEKLFSKPEYQENENLMDWTNRIVELSFNEEDLNARIFILEALFGKEEYRNNAKLMKWAGKIVAECSGKEAADAKVKMLNVFFSKEEYKNNEHLMKGIGPIINNCTAIEQVEAKSKMLEVIFGNEEYKNNENLMQQLGNIINSCSSLNDVAAKQKALELCITEKKLTENPNIQECIGYIVANSSSNNKVLDMANKYLNEPLLHNNDSVKKYAGYIICGANNEHMTNILDKYLAEPKLNQNPNLQSMIGDIIVYTNKEEVSKSRLNIIDTYIKFPEWHNDTSIQKELGNIIKRCTTLKQVQSSLEFFQKYIADKEAFEHKYGAGNFGKILSVYSVDNVRLLEQAVQTPNLNKDKIPNILKSSYIEDLGDDAGGNAGHIDDTKVQRFINLLENPRISSFVVDLLNSDVDMDTASFLAKTKQGYYLNIQENNNPYISKNSNYSSSQIEFANSLGMNGMKKGEIEALLNFASIDGKVDNEIKGFTLLLLKNGFPPNMVLKEVKSLWDDRTPKKTRQTQETEVVVGGRTKESIKGLERKIIEQYQPSEKIWRDVDATKKWAEEKYQAMKSIEYISTRNTAEDPTLGDKISRQRAEMLDKWYDFMETDTDIKDNPFARITILKAITEDLLPENSKMAVEFNKTLAKKIIAGAMNDVDNVSFRKAYNKALKELSQKGDIGEKIDFDDVKGTMYTVPQTDSSSEDFASNVAKVKAYSDGTNWCIRSWNAAPYIQEGAMHFFVDEYGLTQVCIREDRPGQVTEIQQRQQNGTRPVPYITAIKDFMDRHEIKYPERYLDDALAAKPAFDKLKKELQVFVAKKDYKGILEKLGITVMVKADGTWELSHYKAQLDNFTLNDLGINENDLLANVSSIKGDADFANSNATSLPNLEYVHGQFNFIGSILSDVRSLKEINGFKINW